MLHGIERGREKERDARRHGKVEEKGPGGETLLETEEAEENCVCELYRWLRGRAHLCQCSMARRRITGGKVTESKRERERESERCTCTHTAGGEDTCDRDKERNRGRERGEGDPHSTPSLPTRTSLYALRDPRGGEHRDYRLPPTFSLDSLCLFSVLSPFYPSYLFLALLPISRARS